MKLNKFDKIIFFGRNNCPYSLKILSFLKAKSKTVYFYKSKKVGEILNIKKNHLKCDYIFCLKLLYFKKKTYRCTKI